MQSTFDWRKEAPGHFWAKAENAHFNARLIKELCNADHSKLAETIGYRGNCSHALHEGYVREMGVAMELAIKASICVLTSRGETKGNGLPKSHDLVSLWENAKLPTISAAQKHQLALLAVMIEWASRYPTARSEARDEQAMRELTELENKAYAPLSSTTSSLIIRTAKGIDDDELEGLYQIVMANLLDRMSR